MLPSDHRHDVLSQFRIYSVMETNVSLEVISYTLWDTPMIYDIKEDIIL